MTTDRPYRDRDRILAFLSAAGAADAPRVRYWHPGGDIIWNMYQNTVFDPCATFHLWEDAGELVGIGWFEDPNDFTFQIHPRRPSLRVRWLCRRRYGIYLRQSAAIRVAAQCARRARQPAPLL